MKKILYLKKKTMRKMIAISILSIFLTFQASAEDLTDWILDQAKRWEAFQHTTVIQPDDSQDIWQSFIVDQEGETFDFRNAFGPNLIPWSLDVTRSINLETDGKMTLRLTGIRPGYGLITEDITLSDEVKESELCYTFVVSAKVVDLESGALVNIRKGEKYGLDLPMEENQSNLLELRQVTRGENGVVEELVYHGGSHPDIEVDTENSCFSFPPFTPNNRDILEAVYYAEHR